MTLLHFYRQWDSAWVSSCWCWPVIKSRDSLQKQYLDKTMKVKLVSRLRLLLIIAQLVSRLRLLLIIAQLVSRLRLLLIIAQLVSRLRLLLIIALLVSRLRLLLIIAQLSIIRGMNMCYTHFRTLILEEFLGLTCIWHQHYIWCSKYKHFFILTFYYIWPTVQRKKSMSLNKLNTKWKLHLERFLFL